MLLMVEQDAGNLQGLNPTRLSHYQNVKKNTISSLLRGLEEQGLVERTLDPEDKRGFFIRITPAGRKLLVDTIPSRLQGINQMTSGLTLAEKQQMIGLLDKLRRSVMPSHSPAHVKEPGHSIN
jgi:DNA-binding MarR family transcriptional regulator